MKFPASILLVMMLSAPDPLLARQNALAELMLGGDPQASAAHRQAIEARIAASPTDAAAWSELAEYSFQRDEPEETIAVINRGLTQVPNAWPLWRTLAEIHFSDAKSGPERVERPGVNRPRRTKSTLDEATFRKNSLEAALDAMDHAVELRPDDAALAEQRVEAFFGLERWAEAEAALTKMLQRWRTGELSARRAFCLKQLGRTDEASAELKSGLASFPRGAALHYVSARVLESGGNAAGAAEADAQAEFYGRLLPDSRIDYTPESGASLQRMFGTKEGTSGMFSGDRKNEEIAAEIEVLGARDDEVSAELLATLAYSHFAHGALEDRAFALLGKRRDVGRLLRIYTHARASCTTGSCLRQLVHLRAGGVYEKLCELLPKDGGMFPMGVVNLLVELNDPRTAEPLLAYIQDARAPSFEDALVALGNFDSTQTRLQLERWTRDKAAAPFAATGLYRITRERKWLKPITPFMRKADVYELWSIADSLRAVDTKEARQLVAKFDARRAQELAKEKKKRANR